MRNPHKLTMIAGLVAATCVGLSAARAANAPPPFAGYLYRTPTVQGTVASTTEHSVTLDTDANDRMTFVVDSRSVVPASLPSGSQVRVEFVAMSADAFHAQRIIPLTAGEVRAMEENSGTKIRASEQTGAPSSESGMTASGSEASTPASEGENGASSAGEATTAQSGAEPTAAQGSSATGTEATTPAPEATSTDQSAPAPGATDEQGLDQLPRTASPLPLVGLLALLSFGAAAGIGLLRRRRA